MSIRIAAARLREKLLTQRWLNRWLTRVFISLLIIVTATGGVGARLKIRRRRFYQQSTKASNSPSYQRLHILHQYHGRNFLWHRRKPILAVTSCRSMRSNNKLHHSHHEKHYARRRRRSNPSLAEKREKNSNRLLSLVVVPPVRSTLLINVGEEHSFFPKLRTCIWLIVPLCIFLAITFFCDVNEILFLIITDVERTVAADTGGWRVITGRFARFLETQDHDQRSKINCWPPVLHHFTYRSRWNIWRNAWRTSALFRALENPTQSG